MARVTISLVLALSAWCGSTQSLAGTPTPGYEFEPIIVDTAADGIGVAPQVYGMSANGSLVVGAAFFESGGCFGSGLFGFRWSESGPEIRLGIFDSGVETCSTTATGISGGGQISGYAGYNGFPFPQSSAVRWSASGGFSALQHLAEFPQRSQGLGISDSPIGVVVGTSANENFEDRPVRFVGGIPTDLGTFRADNSGQGRAVACSADGSIVVGACSDDIAFESGFVYDHGLGVKSRIPSIDPENPDESPAAFGVSSNGRWVVGLSSVGTFRYDRQTDTNENLGGWIDIPSVANDVSRCGTTIVGTTGGSVNEAVIWREGVGWRSIADVMRANGFFDDLIGWEFQNATAVSDDGITIIGNGTFEGQDAAWLVRIPLDDPSQSCSENPFCADLDGNGTVDLADLNRVLAAFGSDDDSGDVDGSGTTDLADLNQVLGQFGSGC